MDTDHYKSLAGPSSSEFKEKGSRFIAYACPVDRLEEAEKAIERLRKKYHDATHNCFAYRLGFDMREIFRFSDDGEPSGTAGKPILQAITSLELTNVLVLVTRYYGGTKLGTGGLIRAYGSVAAQALQNAKIVTHYLTDVLQLQCSYHDLSTVMNLLHKVDGVVQSSDYGSAVALQVEVKIGQTKQFISNIIDHTAGRVTPALIETRE